MKELEIKRGDTSPSLKFAISPVSIVLSGATVVFNMKPEDSDTLKITRAPAVVEVATGNPTLRYDWSPGDTDTDGRFLAEFEVMYSDGSIETFPAKGFIPIVIDPDLG